MPKSVSYFQIVFTLSYQLNESAFPLFSITALVTVYYMVLLTSHGLNLEIFSQILLIRHNPGYHQGCITYRISDESVATLEEF